MIGEVRKREILTQASVKKQPVILAILRNQCDPGLLGRSWISKRTGVIDNPEPPIRDRGGTKDSPCNRRSPRSDQTRKAKDFPGANLKRDILESSA